MLQLDAILEQFEERWRKGSPPHLKQFVVSLNLDESQKWEVLTDLIALDLEYRWRQSNCETETVVGHETSSSSADHSAPSAKPALEDYARHWPEQFARPDEIADLIAEEFRVRHRWGDQPPVSEYFQRYGESDALRTALGGIQRELSLDSPPAEVSDEPSLEELEPLPRCFGRYELLTLLGRGGMGEVYRAHDTELDRTVALKIPRLDKSLPQLRQRFLQEARAAATLRHPHICPVFDAGEINGRPFLTMAYIDGKSLQEHWQADELQALPQTLTILTQVARAIQAAHDQQIVHRDLKPANVIIDHQGEPVVMDFGLAHRAVEENAGRITQTGETLGSPAYMSPEQVEGRINEVGPASDIYSLGVMLFEALTGELPFKGSLGQILAAVTRDEPPRPSALKPDVNSELETLCLQMLAKSPAGRPASMTNVADRLDRIQQGLEVDAAAKATKPVESSAQHNNTRRLRALLGIAAVVLLGLFITIQTDKGTIVVRSEVPGVEVLIRQGAKTVDQLEIQTKEKSTTIYSGDYEIVLQGEKVDGLKVTPNKVILTRNKTQIVTVEQIAPEQTPSLERTPRKVQAPAASDEFEKWLEWVAMQGADARLSSVLTKLQELNPGFDGKAENYRIDGRGFARKVRVLNIYSDHMRDLSPLKALPHLHVLLAAAVNWWKSPLQDISPLSDLKELKILYIGNHGKLSDISPLAGLKLEDLLIYHTNVSDLSPVKGMPLEKIGFAYTPVSDLTPLAEIKTLRHLKFWNSKNVSDLTPLSGLQLTYLDCSNTAVTSLSPLKDVPLKSLWFSGTGVTDYSPLKEMPLEGVVLPQHPVRGTPVGDAAPKGEPSASNLAVLRSIESLKTINEKPADQFWKKHRLTTNPLENGTQNEQGESSSQNGKSQR